MTTALTLTQKVSFAASDHGRKRLEPAPPPGSEPAPVPAGKIPRVTRLMALALRFDHLLRTGQVQSQAELARLGHVTRARLTQIMNLLNLAPDIQEDLLFLPRVYEGYDPIRERNLRPIAATADWEKQRRQWAEMRRLSSSGK